MLKVRSDPSIFDIHNSIFDIQKSPFLPLPLSPFPALPLPKKMSQTRAHRLSIIVLGFGLVLAAGCGQQQPPETFAARVGDAYLMPEEVNAALGSLPSSLDSAEARRLFIDQWVTNELLYQESLRRNLRTREEVQRRLAESERAVLIDALVSQLFDEAVDPPNAAEMRAYFEIHKEQLRLREPFVRVRYLFTPHADSARQARAMLQRATPATADSIWMILAERFAHDPVLSQSIAINYVRESQLFVEQPLLRERLSRLGPRQTAPLIESNGFTHLLHLTDRVPAGTLPELSWIEDQVRRQLTIDARKQMYERQVQRLRTEALSREVLVIQ